MSGELVAVAIAVRRFTIAAACGDGERGEGHGGDAAEPSPGNHYASCRTLWWAAGDGPAMWISCLDARRGGQGDSTGTPPYHAAFVSLSSVGPNPSRPV